MKGKKTYAVAIIGGVMAVLSVVYGQMTGTELIPAEMQNELLMALVAAIGAFLRAGVNK
jgi:hypothetical protein